MLKSDDITKLYEQHRKGLLTDEEYQTRVSKLMEMQYLSTFFHTRDITHLIGNEYIVKINRHDHLVVCENRNVTEIYDRWQSQAMINTVAISNKKKTIGTFVDNIEEITSNRS